MSRIFIGDDAVGSVNDDERSGEQPAPAQTSSREALEEIRAELYPRLGGNWTQEQEDEACQAITDLCTKRDTLAQIWILQELVLTTPTEKPLEPRIRELIAELKGKS